MPTALCVLNANYRVIGVDKNKNLIDIINSGKSPLPEPGLENLIKSYLSNNLLTVSVSSSQLLESDIIFVCVPTPLNELTLSADLSYLKNALTEIAMILNKQKLIIIESTIPPTTIRRVVIPLLEEKTGKKAGKDFFVSYCPERISPGNSLTEFTNNPRIIGADDDSSLNLTHLFLKNITKGTIMLSRSTSAELSKLAENSFRDLNIAFANELAMICEQSGADVLEVIHLANTHPRVNIHLPGPGVGGPCLTKDPYFLIQDETSNTSLIRLARNTNDSMPDYVIKTLLKEFENDLKLKDPMILILGVAYKPGVNDTRKSPTIEIINRLRSKKLENIYVHDPYTTESFGTTLINQDLNSVLNKFDCIITVTAHKQYKHLDLSLLKKNCVLVDAARIFNKESFHDIDIKYLPLGSR